MGGSAFTDVHRTEALLLVEKALDVVVDAPLERAT